MKRKVIVLALSTVFALSGLLTIGANHRLTGVSNTSNIVADGVDPEPWIIKPIVAEGVDPEPWIIKNI